MANSRVRRNLDVYSFHIDNMGHVSNIVFIQWMEILRIALLEEVGLPLAEIAARGFGPVLVETQVSYRQQVRLGDKITGEIWLTELKGASATMAIQFANQDGLVVATGTQRGLFMEFESQRPKRLLPDERERFAHFLAETTS
jgi:acyl-CoA thioester hydrolase